MPLSGILMWVRRLVTSHGADDLSGTSADITTTLAYNPASQLISRTRSNTAYAFAGPTGTGNPTVSRAYAVNGLNQYTTVGADTFGYDNNGNLTSDGTTTFGYDVENRLTSGGSATLSYDPMGRLYKVATSSSTETYLYAGDQRIAEYDGSGTMTARYVPGAGGDNPLIWYAGSTTTGPQALQGDERGSIVSVADASGTLVQINSYDEFGIPAAANIGRYGYTGQLWVPQLGLWYYKARMYSPTLGRFMQTDPIGYDDQNNLYAYVGNDAINLADPTGLWDCVKGTSTEDCDEFDKYVGGIKDARDSYDKKSSEYKRLDKLVGDFGTRGDGNGVTFKNSVTESGGVAETSGKAITVDLTMLHAEQAASRDFDRIKGAAASDQYDTIYGAGIVGHEFDHSENWPFPQTLDGITNLERSGYTTQEAIWRNFGIRSFDNAAWGTGKTWVDNKTPFSVRNWCARAKVCTSLW